MNLIHTTPEVAIILALFGMRVIKVGRRVSAAWSNLLPSLWEKNLKREEQRHFYFTNRDVIIETLLSVNRFEVTIMYKLVPVKPFAQLQ